MQLTLGAGTAADASSLSDHRPEAPAPDIGPEPQPERTPSGGTEPRRDAMITLPIARYYTRDELSVPPRIEVAMPDRVEDSWPRFQPGKMVLRLFLDENGQVDRISIDESDLPIEFEALALAALRSGIFSPGQLEGRSVKSQIRIQIDFESEAGTSQATPSPSAAEN